MSSQQETSVTVTADLVRNCNGVALDMGGSVLKVIYKSAENDQEVLDNDTTVGHLQVVSFPRSRFTEALDFISSVLEPGNGHGDKRIIYATGFGCSVNRKMITERLNVSLENLPELNCMVKSFHYLAASLSVSQLFEPFDVDAGSKNFANDLQYLQAFNAVVALGNPPRSIDVERLKDPEMTLGRVVNESPLPAAESEPGMYPCLLVTVGSGAAYLQIEADGSFKMLDVSFAGGVTFYGMGCALTGCEGNEQNVHTFSDIALQQDGQANGVSVYGYASNVNPYLLFNFGRCAGSKPGDFKREDLASALLSHHVLETAHVTTLVASLTGINRVFFSGTFFNTPLVRSVTTAMMVKRNTLTAAALEQKPIKFDFLKSGPYMGAIGALIHQTVKSAENKSSTPAEQ
jgi:pantothenate kinase